LCVHGLRSTRVVEIKVGALVRAWQGTEIV
jgi:hypothetical protein